VNSMWLRHQSKRLAGGPGREIRCRFIILARKDEPTPDYAHHLEHRVESHIFLCVLAYHLLVAIQTTLQRQEIHTSWATVRDLLATHQIATIILPTGQNGVLADSS